MASTWSALADPHRRAVVELLLDRPRTVGEITRELGLTQPGTSKHLRTLREAGLVSVSADAQRRVYALRPAPLAELHAWLEPYRRFWEERLDALGAHLDAAGAGLATAPGLTTAPGPSTAHGLTGPDTHPNPTTPED